MSVLIVSVTQEVQNLLVGGIPLAMNNKIGYNSSGSDMNGFH